MNLYDISYTDLDLSPTWLKVLDKVRDIPGVLAVYPSGSRYIGGYTTDSDLDIVVFAQNREGIIEAGYEVPNVRGLASILEAVVCEVCTDTYPNARSYRKGIVNLIVHDSPDKWLQTVAATELCRVQRVSTKDARYSIHEIVKGEHE